MLYCPAVILSSTYDNHVLKVVNCYKQARTARDIPGYSAAYWSNRQGSNRMWHHTNWIP